MESIEAKQRQERLVAEQKAAKLLKKQEKLREQQLKAQQRRQEKENLRRRHEEATGQGLIRHDSTDSQSIEVDIQQSSSLLDTAGRDDEELDYDDDISSSSSSLPLGDPQLVNGYAALSGACGTYAVREPEGLVVLPLDPNRPKYNVTKNYGDEKKDGSEPSSTHFSSIFNKSGENNEIGSIPSSRSAREPFSISEGQKLQVVGVMESNDHGVYQLARGVGFVVATSKQLVKGT